MREMSVIESSIPELRKAFYTTIYRQSFSPDGEWLIASDSRSRLSLFSLCSALSQESASSSFRSFASIIQLEKPILALQTVESVLLCSDEVGQLRAFCWKDLISSADLSAVSTNYEPVAPIFKTNILLSNSGSSFPLNEINAIRELNDANIICAGAGDNGVVLVNIEYPNKVISSFPGHTEYVNELAVRSANEFLSASEDGTVRMWDRRSKGEVCVFNVSEETRLMRSDCGKGVCALDTSNDFMVCGGDVELGIWHLGSRSLAQPLLCKRPPYMRHIVAKMSEEKILCGGANCSYLLQFNYAGNHLASVGTSTNGIYTIGVNTAAANALTTVGGSSHLIDALLNLKCVAFSFNTSTAAGDCFKVGEKIVD